VNVESQLQQRIDTLEAALKPFAEISPAFSESGDRTILIVSNFPPITAGHLQAAQQALKN
jgi:hypothetical protein